MHWFIKTFIFISTSTWLKGSLSSCSTVTFCLAAEETGEKVFSFKLALTALTFQKEEKALGWWNAARESRTKRVVLSLIQICVLQTQQEKKGFLKGANVSVTLWQDAATQCDALHLQFSPSHVSAVEDTVALKYNRPTESFDGVKCATVQFHPQWYTDLSGKSPKSGQFCTQGKWTFLAQTDLISVWFTTSNRVMSQCHVHIIHSFIFLSKKHNKSVEEKGTIWIEGFFFCAHRG